MKHFPTQYGILVFCFLFWLASCGGLSARDIDELGFDLLEVGSETPSGQVDSIIKGPDGFIWFATKEGAHRYDGYDIKSYGQDKENPHSLINSQALCFHVDAAQRLWIGTQMGISRYDSERDAFDNYLLDKEDLNSNLGNHVNAILHDSQGNIYASSEKGFVYLFDEAVNDFRRLNGLSFGIIKSMTIDDKDRLWVGSMNDMFCFTPETSDVVLYRGKFGNQDESMHNFINSILYVNEREIWVGTSVRGALKFDSVSGTVEDPPIQSTNEVYVHILLRDEAGNIWIGHNDGITILPSDGGDPIRYDQHRDLGPLPGSGIHALYIDEQKNVWAGSAFHGIYMSVNNKRFHRMERFVTDAEPKREPVISSLLYESDNSLWVGYNSTGLDIIPLDGGVGKALRHRDGESGCISPYTVFMIEKDSRGDIWVGTYQGGLQRYDRETGLFETWEPDPDDPFSIAGWDIRGMAEDEAGDIWFLTHGQGLSHWDRETGHFRCFQYNAEKHETSLLDNWPNSILYSSDHHVLVGTAVGLSVFDPETETCRNFATKADDPEGLSNSVINCILEDSKNRIWLGTNDGLILFDPKTGHGKTYSLEQGMPNRVVVSLIEDDRGMLWAGTYKGLAMLNPTIGSIKTYDMGDGLVHNEFLARSVVKGADGTLYFGQKNGITYFKPREIHENTYIPEVHMTDFKLFNKSVEVESGANRPGVLNKHVLKADGIVLSHDQKVISLEFVGLNFIQSYKNRYAYKLEGFEEDWNYLDRRKEVNYTNLSPGNYTFLVKASNNDGYWNNEPMSFAIRVLPAFWQTLWFRSLLGLLIICIPGLVVYLRIHQIRNRNQLLESTVGIRTSELKDAHNQLSGAYSQLEDHQQRIQAQNKELNTHRENLERLVQERTRELKLAKEKAEHSDLLKSAFLANMSHEIRTPMNAIMGFLEILEFPDVDESERCRFTKLINQSGHTLMTLIDDILDLSKIEANQFQVQPELTDIDELCGGLQESFVRTLDVEKQNSLTLKLRRDSTEVDQFEEEDKILCQVDRVRLSQILSNLMSNAVKFTDAGFVELNYGLRDSDAGRMVYFEVKDTGIGISEADMTQIFERFVKVAVHGEKIYRGTGLGLTISQKLAELRGGSLQVKSKAGVGSMFTLQIPYLSGEASGADEQEGGHNASEEDPVKERGAPDLSAFTILVAEDEVPNFEYISKVLDRTGVRVVWAMDGQEALEKYEQENFDLILLDLKMPILDGYAVLRKVRESNPDIPIVVQSAFAMNEDRKSALASGASDFLSKPFSIGQLLEKLEQHLV